MPSPTEPAPAVGAAPARRPTLTVEPVTGDRLPDLAAVFGTNKTTSGCYCMWFLIPSKECSAGWRGGNRTAFEDVTRTSDVPMGVLAYRDREPVGWCAAGPRSRYARALRSPVLAGRDRQHDAEVWLLPCFYVRRDARKIGVARTLITGAVDLARQHGASAIECFPLAGDRRRSTGEAFVGVEPMFAAHGFTVVDRPTAARVVMRLDLNSPGTARRTGRR